MHLIPTSPIVHIPKPSWINITLSYHRSLLPSPVRSPEWEQWSFHAHASKRKLDLAMRGLPVPNFLVDDLYEQAKAHLTSEAPDVAEALTLLQTCRELLVGQQYEPASYRNLVKEAAGQSGAKTGRKSKEAAGHGGAKTGRRPSRSP